MSARGGNGLQVRNLEVGNSEPLRPQVSNGTPDVPSSMVSQRSSFTRSVEKLIQAPPPSASFGSTAFNLLKNMLGSSFLSLPDAFKFGSILPSFIIFFIVSSMAAFTMTFLAVLCDKYHVKSYRAVWVKVVGPRTAPAVDFAICLNSLLSCVSYCLLTGSWMTQGLRDLCGEAFGHRVLNTVIIAVFLLFPLTLLRDLHPLRHTSLLGVICNIFGVGFVVWQAWLHWDERIPGRTCGDLRPDNSCTSSEVLAANFFVPTPVKMVATWTMGSSMMMAHYNVPKFYSEFYDQRPYAFGRAIFLSVFTALVLACTLGFSGVMRFGAGMPDANVLKHFNDQFPGKPSGIMSDSERVLTLITWCVMSLNIIASFPLLFSPLRTSLLELRGVSLQDLSPNSYTMLTGGILSVIVVFGLVVPSLTIVTKFKGAICGMGIAYIFPGVLLWRESGSSSERRPPQVVFAVFCILGAGIFLALWGTIGAIEGLVPRSDLQ